MTEIIHLGTMGLREAFEKFKELDHDRLVSVDIAPQDNATLEQMLSDIRNERLTRNDLIESMARAAWTAMDEPEPWEELPQAVRDEWIGYQRAALEALESRVPSVREVIDGALSGA